MQHIRNSVKGVFFLEHSTIPVSTFTDFSEPIIDGSLCVDRSNNDLYILKSGIWTIIGNNDIIGGVIETTYNDLTNLQGSNGLTPGQFYKIEYQTIHQIPNTTDINIGVIENLILVAISNNKFHKNVLSVEFPYDEIYYDFENNIAEDSSTNRPGFITYRKDMLKNNETWYDFRNVKYRRWKISTTLNTNWSAGTNFFEGDIVINSDILWQCTIDHNTTLSFNTDNFIPMLTNLSTQYYAWDTNITIANKIIYSGISFQDYLTFDVSNSNNVKIGKPHNNDIFNNITIINPQFDSNIIYGDINIGDNSLNLVINGQYIKSGKNCKNNILGIESGFINIDDNFSNSIINNNCRSINIKSECSNIILYNSDNINIEKNSTNISIYSSDNININQSNNNIRLQQNCNNIDVDFNTTNIYFNQNNTNINILSSCNNIRFLGNINNNITINNDSENIIFNGSSNNDIIINSDSNDINFGSICNQIVIGSNSTSLIFNDSIDNILFGMNNTNISIPSNTKFLTFANNCDNIFLGNSCDGSIFGNNCFDITMGNSCSYCVFGNNNSNIILNDGCAVNSFGNLNTNIALPIGSLNNTFSDNFSNKIFNLPPIGLKVLISDTNSVTYNNSFQNVVANMKDSNNDIWYQSVDILGTITTIKMV